MRTHSFDIALSSVLTLNIRCLLTLRAKKISLSFFSSLKESLLKINEYIKCAVLQTCTHAAETEQISSNLGEVMDEIGNPSDTDTSPSRLDAMSIENQNDRMMYKRHMGAIAALSGSRQLTGSKSFTLPSKKHIGSIASAAAQSMGRTSAGRKLELVFPTKVELYKRHLGALMALSGTKPRPYRRSLKEPLSGYQMDSQAGIFELETPPMSFTGLDVVGRNGALSDADITIPDEIQSAAAAGSLSDYADELSSENEFQHMNNNEILDQNLSSTALNGDDVGAYKSKRFLGKLFVLFLEDT